MEDLTEDQVLEIAQKFFPNISPEQIMGGFNQMKEQFGLNNYETVVMIQKQMEGDKAAAEGGQFPGLVSRLRGRK